CVAGEGLNDLRLVVEGDDESVIFFAPQHAEKKIDRSILLELEPVANAVGSVHQDADAQRQIRLLAEEANLLRFAFVKNFKVNFIQVGHQFVAPVQHGEKHVDESDFPG